MSYDLAVWHSETSMSVEQALQTYLACCEGGPVPLLAPSEKLHLFVRDLGREYPPIDDVPEEKIHKCPWSNAHELGDGYVLINMTWSVWRIIRLERLIRKLARKHGLHCYNPQTDKLHVPV